MNNVNPRIQKAKKILESKSVKETAQILKVLCGPSRFKIVVLLKYFPSGLTVTQISEMLGASLSRISHQLKILRKHKMVEGKGRNREVLYTLHNHHIRKHLSF